MAGRHAAAYSDQLMPLDEDSQLSIVQLREKLHGPAAPQHRGNDPEEEH